MVAASDEVDSLLSSIDPQQLPIGEIQGLKFKAAARNSNSSNVFLSLIAAMSYYDFYRLNLEPFSNAPAARFYFSSPQHETAPWQAALRHR